MGWMDVLVVVIFAINAIKGWSKGFILSFFSAISFIVSVITAKTYYPDISKYIIGNAAIFSKIQGLVGMRYDGAVETAVMDGTIGGNGNILQVLKLPKILEELFIKSEAVRDFSLKAMDGIHGYMVDTLTRIFIEFLSFMLIFFCIKILLSFIAHILNGAAKLPVLKQFNRIGGLGFGFLKGLLIVFLFLMIITPFTAMTEQGILMEGLKNSIITQYLYDHNPIIRIMDGSFQI